MNKFSAIVNTREASRTAVRKIELEDVMEVINI